MDDAGVRVKVGQAGDGADATRCPLPAENRASVSLVQNTIVHIQLDCRVISSVSHAEVAVNTTTLPACTTFLMDMRELDDAQAPEFDVPSLGLTGIVLSSMWLILCLFAAAKLLWLASVPQLHNGKPHVRHDVVCCSGVHGHSEFRPTLDAG